MTPRLLILETSHQPGVVAVAEGPCVRGERRLDEARRHARDLAPVVAALLAEQGWRARDLEGVVVSRGPGSYTGLRVGVMSAKTLAYAIGCRLLAIETFAAISRQAPAEARVLDVIADAQQDKVYVQRFGRNQPGDDWQAASPLAIVSFAAWLETLQPDVWVSGPGLAGQASRLPSAIPVVAETEWYPRATSLLALGLERWERGEGDDPFAVQPLYLRASSAEEKWGQRT
jgi:tRNA threonylcarbamoyladenosine biosynthesis protein TsaB